MQQLTATIVLRCRGPGAIYDLGCSTGTTFKALIERAGEPLDLVGIDKSEEMLAACQRKLMPMLGRHRLRLYRGDLEDLSTLAIEDCGALVISLVAQFLRPHSRQKLLALLSERLDRGGCLVMIEKTGQRSAAIDASFAAYYESFKRENGYTESEITRKREALENRLVPFSSDENLSMLRDAGFKDTEIFFSCFNFQGYLALKL
jgi:tRNA (cmo5U34)-methyltransferase